MFNLLENFSSQDHTLLHKVVLVSYILFGTFILKLLIGQRQRFIRNDKNILVTYVLFLIYYAGTRRVGIGMDTYNYYHYFYIPAINAGGFFAVFEVLSTDFLFEVIVAVTTTLYKNFTFFLMSIAIIFNVTLYKFVRKFTNYGKDGSSLILFLTLASSFSFLSLELNVVRNALSMGFILLLIYSILQKDKKKVVIYAIIAYLFHRTAIIPIVIVLAIIFVKKAPIKYYLVFYILAIGVAMAGLGFNSIPLLATIGGDDMQALIFTGDTTYKIGFRPDFVAYNTFFLILFIKFSNKNPNDLFLIKYYILSSAIFFFNFNIPFSDRFGLYSWVIIPLLLYNTVNEKFPKRKVFILTIVLFLFFIINNILLFN